MRLVEWGDGSGDKRLLATLDFLRWRRMERVGGPSGPVSSSGPDGGGI